MVLMVSLDMPGRCWLAAGALVGSLLKGGTAMAIWVGVGAIGFIVCTAGSEGICAGTAVAVGSGVFVSVGVKDGVAAVGGMVCAVGVDDGVQVAVGERMLVTVGEGNGVHVAVGRGVSVDVGNGVDVAVGEGVSVGVGAGDGVHVAVGTGVSVDAGVEVGGGAQICSNGTRGGGWLVPQLHPSTSSGWTV
jgi:hypothetical protein